MLLEAIITDITRRQLPDGVCIAAAHQGRTIRLANPQPRDEWVASVGGLMPGDVVSLDCRPIPKPAPPHTEDYEWDPATFVKRRRLTEDALIDRLSADAFDCVEDAFGTPWFCGANGNAAFRPGEGARSLATIRAITVKVHASFGEIRVTFEDAKNHWAAVPLQDLLVKQHQQRCRTCASNLEQALKREFESANAMVRVGLAREWRVPDHPSACWMQVNHIFLMPAKRNHFV
jgi:hypothetical protein